MPSIAREKLHAVYDDDLTEVLEALGVFSDFAGGRLRCAQCGDVITEENLYALYPDSGQVKVVCHKADCIAGLVAKQADRP